MLFGSGRMTSRKLARKVVDGVLAELPGEKPPCRSHSQKKWTDAVSKVLKSLGAEIGCECYPWLVDWIWWREQELVLAVECEWRQRVGEEDDFQKLTVFKCPLKLFVFSGSAERAVGMAVSYLQQRRQHVKDEEYILIGFTPLSPRCFFFKVPGNGKLNRAEVLFSEPLEFAY